MNAMILRLSRTTGLQRKRNDEEDSLCNFYRFDTPQTFQSRKGVQLSSHLRAEHLEKQVVRLAEPQLPLAAVLLLGPVWLQPARERLLREQAASPGLGVSVWLEPQL
ncbi:hypothetical protein [Donghicola eburneus]|uniref:hypothetical protein n=1 Tax=Donghicola eburneus TaxID=393278 RepID=UPI0015A66210|nr:hypothetical protein [Donghicola eburneus]